MRYYLLVLCLLCFGCDKLSRTDRKFWPGDEVEFKVDGSKGIVDRCSSLSSTCTVGHMTAHGYKYKRVNQYEIRLKRKYRDMREQE